MGRRAGRGDAVLEEEQRRNAPLPKAEVLKLLPPGTQVSLTLQPDTSWAGTLDVADTKENRGMINAAIHMLKVEES